MNESHQLISCFSAVRKMPTFADERLKPPDVTHPLHYRIFDFNLKFIFASESVQKMLSFDIVRQKVSFPFEVPCP